MPSSVIRTFVYEAARQSPLITFTSGRRYRYLQVPEATYEAMKMSFAKGEFFNRKIRGQFEWQSDP